MSYFCPQKTVCKNLGSAPEGQGGLSQQTSNLHWHHKSKHDFEWDALGNTTTIYNIGKKMGSIHPSYFGGSPGYLTFDPWPYESPAEHLSPSHCVQHLTKANHGFTRCFIRLSLKTGILVPPKRDRGHIRPYPRGRIRP